MEGPERCDALRSGSNFWYVDAKGFRRVTAVAYIESVGAEESMNGEVSGLEDNRDRKR